MNCTSIGIILKGKGKVKKYENHENVLTLINQEKKLVDMPQ